MDGLDLDVLAWRLFEESNDAVFILNAKSETVWQANPAAQRLTGLRWRQLRGRRLGDLIISDHANGMSQLQSAMRETGYFHSREEYRLCRNEQDPLPVNVTASKIHTTAGEIGLVVARDISERKQAEVELQNFNRELERQVTLQTKELTKTNARLERRVAERTTELEETNAELRVFAETVSHDLKAPIRAVEGFALALAEDCREQLGNDGHEYVQHIVDSAQRMEMLVNGLLDYSRLSYKELRLTEVSLESVVRESLMQLKADLRLRRVAVDVAKALPKVLGHQATLVRIVSNLITNAIKFIPQGRHPQVRIWTVSVNYGRLRLYVEDNGIGIADNDLSRIFGVFERLHGIESYPGTGIGLAIVARACQRLGCEYGVVSESGKGSQFWVEFALASSATIHTRELQAG